VEWRPVAGLALDGSADALRDSYPDGDVVTGPGDVDLGVLAGRTWSLGYPETHAAFGLGWRVKLPDASDRGELGSDETDVAPLAAAALEHRRIRFVLTGGLAVLGNPLRYASQDDVPFIQAHLVHPSYGTGAIGENPLLAKLAIDLGVNWAFATSRNPARGEIQAGAVIGRTWLLDLQAAAGLTPAAPDLRLLAGFGYAW
jgi:hypothetical protein